MYVCICASYYCGVWFVEDVPSQVLLIFPKALSSSMSFVDLGNEPVHSILILISACQTSSITGACVIQ
jgi:hypothetical protein